jgi:hypothetical protein
MSADKDIQFAKKIWEEARKKMCDELRALPQNPKINETSQNTFAMDYAELASNEMALSPFYYNFKRQYEILASLIEISSPDNIHKIILGAIKNKNIGGNPLHPEVIKHIKKYFNL